MPVLSPIGRRPVLLAALLVALVLPAGAQVPLLAGPDPNDAEVLLAHADALGAMDDRDGELAYLLLARAALDGTLPADEKQADRLARTLDKRLARLDGVSTVLGKALTELLRELGNALKLFSRNDRFPRNALDVAGTMLRIRPAHDGARQAAERIGGPEARRLLGAWERRRPFAWLWQWRRDHLRWADAAEYETARYVVVSNIDADLLRRAAHLLEDVADHAAAFYGVPGVLDARRGKSRVELFRGRADYLAAGGSPDAFWTTTMTWTPTDDGSLLPSYRIRALDPREVGRPIEDLFETLLQTGSAQALHLRCRADVPDWLVVGLGESYGAARIDDDGRLHLGLPAREHLVHLHHLLTADEAPLFAVLAGGEQRPDGWRAVAWGLVHFLQWYQDEAGAFPYRPAFATLFDRCAEIGLKGRIDGLELFVRAVLEPRGLTLPQLERTWAAWCQRLWQLEQDPAAALEHHLAAARDGEGRGATGVARESYGQVLLRDPGHVEATLALARLAAADGSPAARDEALLLARRAHRLAQRRGEEASAEAALAVARPIEGSALGRLLAAEDAYRAAVEQQIERQLAAQRPVTALAIARGFLDRVLGDERLPALAEALRAEGVHDLRLRRTLFERGDLSFVVAEPEAFRFDGNALVGHVERPQTATVQLSEPLAPRAQLEANVRLRDGNAVLVACLSEPGRLGPVGVALRAADPAAPEPAARYLPFDALPPGHLALAGEQYDERGWKRFTLEAPVAMPRPLEVGRWFRFVLSRAEPGALTFSIAGHELGRFAVPPASGPLAVRLVLWGGGAEIEKLDVVELDRM